MTNGEYRVGISFNPSGDDVVTTIKQKAAELIDLIHKVGWQNPQSSEVQPFEVLPWTAQSDDFDRGYETHRLRELAANAIEEGAMWAVKAATKRPSP